MSYNHKIFEIEGHKNQEEWTKQFLLGLVSEIDEVLREINWKRHRKNTIRHMVRENVLEEIVDLMKYVISIAQIWGFSQQALLEAMENKNKVLNFKLKMEFAPEHRHQRILITDIDQTLGDYQATFMQWAISGGYDIKGIKMPQTIHIDHDLEMEYPQYSALKEKFEATGQYAKLKIYPDTVESMKYWHDLGYYIIVVTARPVEQFKRIFKDTMTWFSYHRIHMDELRMMGEGRVLLACDLRKQENSVMLWEDDPLYIQRASNSGIPTYVRKHPYNEDLGELPNVTLVDSFMEVMYGRE